jgi:hypothetical protein
MKLKGTEKSQIPNPKFQTNPNNQIQKCQTGEQFPIESWDLGFVWSLGFGIWDLHGARDVWEEQEDFARWRTRCRL